MGIYSEAGKKERVVISSVIAMLQSESGPEKAA